MLLRPARRCWLRAARRGGLQQALRYGLHPVEPAALGAASVSHQLPTVARSELLPRCGLGQARCCVLGQGQCCGLGQARWGRRWAAGLGVAALQRDAAGGWGRRGAVDWCRGGTAGLGWRGVRARAGAGPRAGAGAALRAGQGGAAGWGRGGDATVAGVALRAGATLLAWAVAALRARAGAGQRLAWTLPERLQKRMGLACAGTDAAECVARRRARTLPARLGESCPVTGSAGGAHAVRMWSRPARDPSHGAAI